MSTYYLRLEGVNLRHFVYDTDDLSTVRGGGLGLLRAPLRAERELSTQTGGKFKRLSEGASWALWAFEAPGDSEARKVHDTIIQFLRADDLLRHASFVVDLVPIARPTAGIEKPFLVDRERLLALNRHRQLTTPSLAVPEWNQGGHGVCGTDRIRPADSGKLNRDKLPISRAAHARWVHGVEQRQNLYKEEAGCPEELTFTDHFDQLAGDQREEAEPLPPGSDPLVGKMAVIYTDGNQFGARMKAASQTPDEQAANSRLIRSLQRKLLADFIAHIQRASGWRYGRQGRLRLETLLWGGDELIWVVPAWKGWETLQFFFDHTSRTHRLKPTDLESEVEWEWALGGRPLTHAAGLVFSSHKAPIQRVINLAKELADAAKKRDRTKNCFSYEVLESFDHLGGSLEEYRKRALPNWTQPGELLLEPKQMAALVRAAKNLAASDFPRSRLHDWVLDALARLHAEDKLGEHLKKAKAEFAEHWSQLQPLAGAFHGPVFWLHLVELWDYLVAATLEEH